MCPRFLLLPGYNNWRKKQTNITYIPATRSGSDSENPYLVHVTVWQPGVKHRRTRTVASPIALLVQFSYRALKEKQYILHLLPSSFTNKHDSGIQNTIISFNPSGYNYRSLRVNSLSLVYQTAIVMRVLNQERTAPPRHRICCFYIVWHSAGPFTDSAFIVGEMKCKLETSTWRSMLYALPSHRFERSCTYTEPWRCMTGMRFDNWRDACGGIIFGRVVTKKIIKLTW